MNLHIFDRSNLDDVVALNPEKGKITRRQDLESNYMPRTDIVLLNCVRSGGQYTLHVTPYGFYGDMWLLDILSEEQYKQVIGIGNRMRENAFNFRPAQKLLVNIVHKR